MTSTVKNIVNFCIGKSSKKRSKDEDDEDYEDDEDDEDDINDGLTQMIKKKKLKNMRH